MTERQKAAELTRAVMAESGLGAARPAVSGSLAQRLADVLLELDRLAGLVDDVRRVVGEAT